MNRRPIWTRRGNAPLVRLITEFNSDEKRSSLNQIIAITHDKEIFEDSEVNAVFQFQKTGDTTSVTKS